VYSFGFFAYSFFFKEKKKVDIAVNQLKGGDKTRTTFEVVGLSASVFCFDFFSLLIYFQGCFEGFEIFGF